MKIIDSTRFVYIHIPKCGGTSVTRSLPGVKTSLVDNGHGELSAHVPLKHISKTDPNTFAKILDYESFAHVREPVLRFRSALFQHAREYLRLPSVELTEAKLSAIAHNVKQVLESNQMPHSKRYEHFTPQHTFLEIDGERIVENISPTGDYTLINQHFEKNGLKLIEKHENMSLRPRDGLFGRCAKVAKPIVRLLLSEQTKYNIWSILVRMEMYRPISEESPDFLLEDKTIQELIKNYYARDFEIYAEACGSQDPKP